MQILVPELLREKVMEVAHNFLFGGHLGVKKTKDRIQTNFFWPELHNDLPVFAGCVTFVRKLCPEDRYHGLASLGDMPLIDQPFKR